MRELHLRDLYTELGEQIDATEDMESFLKIRLDMATLREENATAVAEEVGKNYAEASKSLEEATSKRIYWESQLQKVQERNQPTSTASADHVTVNVHGNPDPGILSRLIQDRVEESIVFHRPEGTPIESHIYHEPEVKEEPAQEELFDHLGEEEPLTDELVREREEPEQDPTAKAIEGQPEWRQDEYVMASVRGSDRQILKRRYDEETYDDLSGQGDYHWSELTDVARLVEVRPEDEPQLPEGGVRINMGVKLPEDMSEQEFRRRLVEAGNQILRQHEDLGEYR